MTNDNTNPWPTIDLHGQKIEEACKSLSSFIHHHNDERFIHIIHGKGHRLDDGLSILKSQVIHYLKQHPKVLAFCSCQQNLGGTGAVLAYIKNSIDYDVIDPMLWISEKTSDFDSLLQNAEEELIEAWNMALESQNINVQAVAEKEGVIFVNKDSDLFRELVEEGKELIINNSNKRSESDE